MGGPTISSNNSKMADGGRIEFRKMRISPCWTNLFVQNLVRRWNTTTQRCTHDQICNRKLIRMTSLVASLVQNISRFRRLYDLIHLKIDDRHARTCQIRLSWPSRWRWPPFWLSKISISPGQTTGNNCKMAVSLHVVESVSDDYNF